MPIYDYNCAHCDTQFERFAKMSVNSEKRHCPVCGRLANKAPSIPNLVTDTNFCVAGVHHVGVCDPYDKRDVVTDRADFTKRLKDKGLRVLDKAELVNPKVPKPQLCM